GVRAAVGCSNSRRPSPPAPLPQSRERGDLLTPPRKLVPTAWEPIMFHRIPSLLALLILSNFALADAKRDALWAAVRANDVAAVKAAVEKGADVNARNEYGVTALWIAAE